MSDNTLPAPVAALPADLLFASRMRAAAEAAGVRIDIARSPDALRARIRTAPPRRVLIDLDARAWDPVALLRELRQDPAAAGIELIAWVSHVRGDAIDAARAAGADQVVARGAFARRLAEWVVLE